MIVARQPRRRSFMVGRRAVARARPDAKHFVLVHGAWHGAWCWYKTVTLLQADGHRVTVLDLPSHGTDGTPAAGVTLAAYAARVIAAIDAAAEPVILVGHSMGGIVISTVAEAVPAKISRLVYVSAFLLPNGSSLLDIATRDAGSLATPNLIVKAEEGVVDINRDGITAVFYGHSKPEDINLARPLLKANALAPFATPLVLTGANYGGVRRFYISCLEDNAITLAAQQSMVTATPCEAVFPMHTDHSPFFSQPRHLHRILSAIARA
jgi:pimeloyl-ACP methyl ester carboxylesterase